MDNSEAGPKAFTCRLRLVRNNFDQADQSLAFDRLHKSGAPTDTPFLVFTRKLRILISLVLGSKRTVEPTPEMLMDFIQTQLSPQYPVHMTNFYPSDLVTAQPLFKSVRVMLAAFQPLVNNYLPTINRTTVGTLPSLLARFGALNTSRPHHHHYRSAQRSSGSWHQDAPNNLIVLPLSHTGIAETCDRLTNN